MNRAIADGSDHPRIRGEHFVFPRRHPPHEGSSPHTRGALLWRDSTLAQNRIIPAYAGSTKIPGDAGTPGRDHPRIRGEHGGIS